MFTYFQHGRRHGLRGTDPTPFEQPYAIVFGGPVTVPALTPAVTNIALGPFNADWTNDKSVFKIANVVLSGGNNPGTFQGLQIAKAGQYRVRKTLFVSSLRTGITVKQISLYHTSAAGFDLSGIIFGPTSVVVGGASEHMEHFSVVAPPTDAIVLVVANSEALDYDCIVGLEVIRLSEIPLDFS